VPKVNQKTKLLEFNFKMGELGCFRQHTNQNLKTNKNGKPEMITLVNLNPVYNISTIRFFVNKKVFHRSLMEKLIINNISFKVNELPVLGEKQCRI